VMLEISKFVKIQSSQTQVANTVYQIVRLHARNAALV
jgi:hypothetical protein